MTVDLRPFRESHQVALFACCSSELEHKAPPVAPRPAVPPDRGNGSPYTPWPPLQSLQVWMNKRAQTHNQALFELHRTWKRLIVFHSPRTAKMSSDLSWCRCRSWPCCRPTAPDRRAKKSRAKGPSGDASASSRCYRSACAYRSPARLPGLVAGCASSSVVLLIKQFNKKIDISESDIFTLVLCI